jgi:hypothetical protein
MLVVTQAISVKPTVLIFLAELISLSCLTPQLGQIQLLILRLEASLKT